MCGRSWASFFALTVLVREKRPSWEKFLSLPPGWESVGLSPGWENRTDIFSQRVGLLFRNQIRLPHKWKWNKLLHLCKVPCSSPKQATILKKLLNWPGSTKISAIHPKWSLSVKRASDNFPAAQPVHMENTGWTKLSTYRYDCYNVRSSHLTIAHSATKTIHPYILPTFLKRNV